jgi:hypothetical protein
MKKIRILALTAAVILCLCACGKKEAAPAAPAAAPAAAESAAPLALNHWFMSASTWSSPNGATVNITAIPNGYTEGQSAVFCVRLEGDDIASVPCQWDGSAYTASADLNCTDGYCYFVLLTAADGSFTEVAVNTPTYPIDDSLINMATALNAYCEVNIASAQQKGKDLVLEEGTATIQLPFLTLDTGAVTCQNAELLLNHNGEDVAVQKVTVSAADESGLCTADLSGIRFAVPDGIGNDHQLTLRMNVTLSNGHILSAAAGDWHYQNDQLTLAVG